MARDDHALVVGVTGYPGLGDLEGAEADAHAFAAWLEDPDGGDVPENQIKKVLSTTHVATGPTVFDARPSPDDITQYLDRLHAAGRQYGRAGRRLYLYFAGHGVTAGRALQRDDAVFLSANADRGRPIHVPARGYAEWFRLSCYFEEVVLFMDCCRNLVRGSPALSVPYEEEFDATPLAGRWLYGFATRPNALAAEIPWGTGMGMRGAFTLALVEGLRGAAADQSGLVTPTRLRSFVRSYVETLTRELDQSLVGQTPDFGFDDDFPIVFQVTSPPRYRVHLLPADRSAPRSVQLTNGEFVVVEPDSNASGWEWQLPSYGAYLLTVDGATMTILAQGQIRAFTITQIVDGGIVK